MRARLVNVKSAMLAGCCVAALASCGSSSPKSAAPRLTPGRTATTSPSISAGPSARGSSCAQLMLQYSDVLRTAAAIDPTTLKELSEGSAESALIMRAQAEVADAFQVSSSEALTRLLALAKPSSKQALTQFSAQCSSTASAPSGHTVSIDYTDGLGWHYAATFPLPAETLHAHKDIAQSPPGEAQVVATMSGDPLSDISLNDDNPGRPNGPSIDLTFKESFPLPGGLASGPFEYGACGADSQSTVAADEPFADDVDCPGRFAPNSDMGPETQADLIVKDADMSTNGTLVIYWTGSSSRSCAFFVSHAAKVDPAIGYDKSECGDMRVTVS